MKVQHLLGGGDALSFLEYILSEQHAVYPHTPRAFPENKSNPFNIAFMCDLLLICPSSPALCITYRLSFWLCAEQQEESWWQNNPEG